MRVDLKENKNSQQLIIELQDGKSPVSVGDSESSNIFNFQLKEEKIIKDDNENTTVALNPNSTTTESSYIYNGIQRQSDAKMFKDSRLNHEENTPRGASNLSHYSPVITRIRGSLEEKIRRLKNEKILSEEKLHLAQEEEKISALEKNRFQQELIIHRKLRLQKVINQLKMNLKDQSERLQKSYSRVLDVQKLLYRRSFIVTHNLQANSRHNEAPF